MPAQGPIQAELFVIAIKMICVERLQSMGTSHGKGRKGGGGYSVRKRMPGEDLHTSCAV